MLSADQGQTAPRSRAASKSRRHASESRDHASESRDHAGDTASPLTFRSPFAVLVWWAWALFALGNLIDLAVQGRDHSTVVAAFILVLVTGVVYTTAQRPRIKADDDGLSIVNPVRQHRIDWAAVTAVEASDLVRVRCEWPLGDGQATAGQATAGQDTARQDPAGTGSRVIYSWALGSSRRRQVTARLRAERARSRPRGAQAGSPYGTPAGNAQPPVAGEVGPVVEALNARADMARADPGRQPARPPVSTWYWPAVAAIVIPALALVVAVLA